MIQFDTNFLVALVAPMHDVLELTQNWMESNEQIAISSIAWSEFCNGPLIDSSRMLALDVVQDRVLDFSKEQAELAAELFNQTGRRRSSRCDCMIAASAITHRASLATFNHKDFQKFLPHGLRLESLQAN